MIFSSNCLSVSVGFCPPLFPPFCVSSFSLSGFFSLHLSLLPHLIFSVLLPNYISFPFPSHPLLPQSLLIPWCKSHGLHSDCLRTAASPIAQAWTDLVMELDKLLLSQTVMSAQVFHSLLLEVWGKTVLAHLIAQVRGQGGDTRWQSPRRKTFAHLQKLYVLKRVTGFFFRLFGK